MRIILDMDEVLAQTLNHWLDAYNEDVEEKWHRCLEDIKGWNIQLWVKPDVEIYDYLARPGFYRNMPPINGATEGVTRLLDLGHDVIVCTAIPHSAPNAFGEKLEWLEEWIPKFPRNNFIAASRKEVVTGDVLLDDGAHNLVDWPGIAVCMDRPWNRGEHDVDMRVYGWSGFMALIGMMEDENYVLWLRGESRRRLGRLTR